MRDPAWQHECTFASEIISGNFPFKSGRFPAMTAPADANTLRSGEFRKLLRTAKTWIWIGVPALAVAIAVVAGFGGGPLDALVVVAVIFLIGIGITFWIADSRSADAFFSAYAKERGMTWHDDDDDPELDGTSPFLRKGDKRRVDQLFTGPLAEDIEGCLALFTYTVESTDSDGSHSDTDYPYTVVTVKMPEVTGHMPELRVQVKSGFKALEGLEDKFRFGHERVTLESEALRDRYEIFVSRDQDPVWTRRLFSPTFIVWLTESPPKKFAFELEDGYFVAYIPKHRESAAGLDEMRDVSCKVVRRILREVADTTPATTET